MSEELERAAELLQQNDATLALVKEGEEDGFSKERGLRPIFLALQKSPHLLEGACVADRVLGRAAALLLVAAGVKEVYGSILSRHAARLLEEHGIPYSYGKLVHCIMNVTRTEMDSDEKRALAISSPQEALAAFTSAKP